MASHRRNPDQSAGDGGDAGEVYGAHSTQAASDEYGAYGAHSANGSSTSYGAHSAQDVGGEYGAHGAQGVGDPYDDVDPYDADAAYDVASAGAHSAYGSSAAAASYQQASASNGRHGRTASAAASQTGYQPQQSYQPQGYQPQGYQTQQNYQQAQYQNSAYRPAEPENYGGGGRHAGSSSNGKKNKGGGAWNVVFWVALIIFIAAIVVLGVIAYSYWEGQQTYEEVASEVFTVPDDVDGTSLEDLVVDWDALEEINPDIVGWIYIPGTVVNYPIVHTTDNDYYLDHDFYDNEGLVTSFGAIFLAAENRGDFSDDNNLIYGHHMADGSMFAIIADMTDQDVFDEYRTIYILTPDGNYRLETFALIDCASDDSEVVVEEFDSEEEQEEYILDKFSRSLVTVDDVDVSDITQTFMFCTCDELATDGRYILYAYVVESTVEGNEVEDEDSAGVIDPEDVETVGDASDETVVNSGEAVEE